MTVLCDLPFRQVIMENWKGNKPLTFCPCHKTEVRYTDEHCSIHDIPNSLEWNENHSDLTPEEVLNHEKYVSLQNDMLNGVRNPICNFCWKKEDNIKIHDDGRTPLLSPRIQKELINTESEGLLISINPGNECNLSCRMCTPIASNRLLLDYQYFYDNNLLDIVRDTTDNFFKLGNNIDSLNSIQWDWIVNNIEKIGALKMAGGEPFFNSKIFDYFDKMNVNHLNLQITTNGTLFTKEKCEILNKFKGLYFVISVDSIGKNYEYIRHPFTFDKFEKSFNIFLNTCYNIKEIKFNCVVSALNVLELDKLLLWANKKNIKISFAKVFPHYRGISIYHLPIDILMIIWKKIRKLNMRDGHLLGDLLENAMRFNRENKTKVMNEIQIFDKSRNQKYQDYLHAEIVDWLDE